MKLKLIQFLLLLLSVLAFSQSKTELKKKESIDQYADTLEKDKGIKKYQFIVKGKDKEITYKYEKKGDKFVKMSRQWEIKNGAYKETYSYHFLMKDEKKIYASEGITYQNYKDPEDLSGWSVQFWLENNQVIYTTSLGHGKTEMDDWDYNKELKENFEYMLKTVKTFDKKKESKEKK